MRRIDSILAARTLPATAPTCAAFIPIYQSAVCKNLTQVKNTPNASHCARFWELAGSFTWTRRHRAEVPATKVSLNVLRETTAVWSPRAY